MEYKLGQMNSFGHREVALLEARGMCKQCMMLFTHFNQNHFKDYCCNKAVHDDVFSVRLDDDFLGSLPHLVSEIGSCCSIAVQNETRNRHYAFMYGEGWNSCSLLWSCDNSSPEICNKVCLVV